VKGRLLQFLLYSGVPRGKKRKRVSFSGLGKMSSGFGSPSRPGSSLKKSCERKTPSIPALFRSSSRKEKEEGLVLELGKNEFGFWFTVPARILLEEKL
jgi:hypothetical protein